ncbi:hypothetical protein MVES_000868 [Malassezia vespertilionis]|uniref:Nuclear rim protein 1 n=1 Tax=Malassezia vespertilionis TaxID=2020962 RepID=A0A2N1JE33_9BASI|nr:hypothetical protein MVES_000868 [Malassezia vespertilionis]
MRRREPAPSAFGASGTPRKSTNEMLRTPVRTPVRGLVSPHLYASPLHRKGAFASPLRTATFAAAPEANAEQHVPKTWNDALWELTVQAALQSLEMELDDVVHEPRMGVPIGIALHLFSLLSQVILPGSALYFPGITPKAKPVHLFAPKGNGYAAYLARVVAEQRRAALLYVSRALSFALVAAALYNTYLLFSRYRTYRLWYRNIRDVLRNPHAQLESPPQAPPPLVSWQAWAYAWMLAGLRQVPIVEWFVPPAAPVAAEAPTEKIYTLRVWDMLEAPLHIFAIYSPAHALWWALVGSLGIWPALAWLSTSLFMALFAAQTFFLAHEYALHVKDQRLLSAEVLREYDEKFVIPRAMPLMIA